MMYSQLSGDRVTSYMERLSSVRVWVLGDVMLDRYYWGAVDRISPEAPVPVVNVTRKSARLGGAANVAANLRSLGVEVALFGVAGADQAGRVIRRLLAKQSIDSSHLLEDDSRESTEKVRIIAQSQQVVRADFEDSDPISDHFKQEIASSLLNGADECDVLIVSDYGKGVVRSDYLQEIIARWRAKGKWFLIDPHVGHFSWYKGASVVTPNAKEAATYLSEPVDDMPSLSKTGFRMKTELALDALLITRGEAGMSLFFGDHEELHVPTVAKEVYDVTGAGDTVVGVLGALLGAGVDLVDAVIIANQAAGEVVKEIGTSTVSREAIISCFK